MALISDSSERNASVISDADSTDLLVIQRDLYNRTFKDGQMAEYRRRREFICGHALFSNCPPKIRRLVEMSLVKRKYSFDTVICKQGQSWDGLHFIIDGCVKVMINPSQHFKQYPSLMKHQASTSDNKTRCLTQTAIHLKRNEGYSAVEKWLSQRFVEFRHLGEGDTFGDMECSFGLPTYLGSMHCLGEVTVYHMDGKNFERLVLKKISKAHEQLKESCSTMLADMERTSTTTRSIPLLLQIYNKYIRVEDTTPSQQKVKPRDKEDKEFLTQHLLQMFIRGKTQLVEPRLPDSIYYQFKSQERRQRKLTAQEKILKAQRENSVNSKVRERNATRKRLERGNIRRPRTRRELANFSLKDFPSRASSSTYRSTDLLYSTNIRRERPATVSAATGYTNSKISPQVVQASAQGSSTSSKSGEIDKTSRTAKAFKFKPSQAKTEKDNLTSLLEAMGAIEHRQQRLSDSLSRPKSAPLLCLSSPRKLPTSLSSPEADVTDHVHNMIDLENKLERFQQKLINDRLGSRPTTATSGRVSSKPVITRMRRQEYQVQVRKPPTTPSSGGTVLVKRKAFAERDNSHARR